MVTVYINKLSWGSPRGLEKNQYKCNKDIRFIVYHKIVLLNWLLSLHLLFIWTQYWELNLNI